MSLFTNPNFIVHIIRSQGGHEYFGEETWLLLQALVELETRKMLETAAKFMRNDRRDVILPEDMDLALSHLGHNDIILAREMAHYRIDGTQALREDPAFQSVEELFRQELKSLGNTVFEEPALKGSWIYIKGKIPSTNENIKLKCLADMRTSKAHEKEEKKKVFNIFKDDPISLMTKEQLDYFQKVTAQISAGTLETGFRVHGNLLNMVPFFLKFLTSMEIN